MLYECLGDNILELVSTFKRVTRNQILTMFRSHKPDAIKYHMDDLLARREMVIDEETGDVISTRPPKVNPTETFYRKLALDVMCSIGDENMKQFYTGIYPTTALFITTADAVYDITIITHNNLESLKMVVPITRRANLMPDTEDTIIHVGVLPDIDMMDKIAPLQFQKFCVITNDKPAFYDGNA